MPTLALREYPVDRLYLFPVYSTRADFKRATGQEPPPYDMTRPPKHWFDPAAASDNSARRNFVYDRVLMLSERGIPIADESGIAQLEPLVIAKSDAATVNIADVGALPVEYKVPPAVPVPLRALQAEEELHVGFSGVTVRNKSLYEETIEGFTAKDREVLRAIARKLEIKL